jgi:hypothetical protein
MILAVALAFATPARRADPAPTLDAVLQEGWSTASANSRWRSPTEVRRSGVIAGADELFRAIQQGCTERALRRAEATLGAVGWRWSVHTLVGEAPVITVHDLQGGGYFAWRCGGASDVLVQAPHSFFDLDTADLARTMFVDRQVRGVMWNTVHRYRATPDEQPEDALHPADVAHQPASLYQTWTLAATKAWPSLRVVQLHGFAGGASVGDVILSSGIEGVTPLAAAARLTGRLGPLEDGAFAAVQVFGVDTDLLGATTNAQARALAGGAGESFLHVELSRDVRAWLRADAARADAFLDVVLEGPWR